MSLGAQQILLVSCIIIIIIIIIIFGHATVSIKATLTNMADYYRPILASRRNIGTPSHVPILIKTVFKARKNAWTSDLKWCKKQKDIL